MNNNISFDAMVQMAAREAVYRQLDSFPSPKELEQMFRPSPAHENRINKLIKKETRFERLVSFNRYFTKVAVVLFVAFTVVFTPLISAKAVRESIVQTVIEWREEFASIFFESERTPAVINDVKIGYMVEGFEESGEVYQNEYVYKESFLHNNENIVLNIYSKHNVVASNTDNEYSEYYSITINNNDGIWIYRNNFSALIISDNNFVYRIDGNINIEELINIYKNIEIS